MVKDWQIYISLIAYLTACEITDPTKQKESWQNRVIGGPCNGVEETLQATLTEIRGSDSFTSNCTNDPREELVTL